MAWSFLGFLLGSFTRLVSPSPLTLRSADDLQRFPALGVKILFLDKLDEVFLR